MKERFSRVFNSKRENGSITLFVLLAVIFFLIVLFGIYYNLNNKSEAQNDEVEKIQKNYETNNIDEMYDEKVNELNSGM